jgi:hypothetical protein
MTACSRGHDVRHLGSPDGYVACVQCQLIEIGLRLKRRISNCVWRSCLASVAMPDMMSKGFDISDLISTFVS